MSRYSTLLDKIAHLQRDGTVTIETWEVNALLDIAKSIAVIADTLTEMVKHDDRLTDDGK